MTAAELATATAIGGMFAVAWVITVFFMTTAIAYFVSGRRASQWVFAILLLVCLFAIAVGKAEAAPALSSTVTIYMEGTSE